MVNEENKGKSTKRFGPRYGRTTRARYAIVEAEQKKKHKCPYCSTPAVKRIAVGIWECRKCSSKFTGRAYTIEKTKTQLESEE